MKRTPPNAKNVKQKLAQVHMKVVVVAVLPTSGSEGQFAVQDQVVSGLRATVVRAE